MENRLYSLIKSVCDQEHIYLVDVALKGTGRNRVIRVIVDTDSGITLDECQHLSRQISDLLERKQAVTGDYRLEVGSPGVRKPLEYPYEFRRNIGRNLNVSYQKDEEVVQVSGELMEYNPADIVIRAGDDAVKIPLDRLKKARVQLKW